MKKLVLFLLCGGMLVGCSQSKYSVQVSENDKVLVSDNEMSVTKQDYFEFLLDQFGSVATINQTLEMIADKEITDQKEIEKNVDKQLKDYIEYTENKLDDYIKSLGYNSQDEFVEKVVRLDAKKELLHHKYLKEHLDELIKEYQVCSLKMIDFEKESDALKAMKEIKSEKDFDKKLKAAKNNGEDAGVINKESTLDENLKKELGNFLKINKDGVYNQVIKLSNEKYCLVYVYDTAHKNLDDILDSLSSINSLTEKITGIYLKKYDFKVYDEKIKDSIKKLSKEYIE